MLLQRLHLKALLREGALSSLHTENIHSHQTLDLLPTAILMVLGFEFEVAAATMSVAAGWITY
jgi:hypothetical protein